MKPAPFEYVCASTLEDALRYVKDWGDAAKILAGDQSLMPLLNMRLAHPTYVIDINRVSALTGVAWHPETQTLTLGALTRHHELMTHPLISAHAPLLSEAARHIGHLAIRSRGTIGGSIAHADPAAELPLVLTALRAVLQIRSVEGQRSMPIGDFFLGYYMTNLDPSELIVAVDVPGLGSNTGYAITEFARRHGDFALASASVVVTVDDAGMIATASSAVGGVAPSAVACPAVDAALRGARDPDDFVRAAEKVTEHIDPVDDVQASRGYRCHLAIELMEQAIHLAYARAMDAKEVLA